MSLNKVMLIGNVGKDPEVRYLENNPSAQPGMAYQQPQQPAYQAQTPAGFQPAAQPAAPEYPAAGDPGDDLPF